MRKSTILKSLLLLCALVAGSSSVWAQFVVEKVTSTDGLTAGEKYLLVCENSNVALGEIGSTGKYYDPTGATITSTLITATPNKTAILTLGGSSGNWTLLSNISGKYLSLTGYSNELKESATATSDDEKWLISFSSNNVVIQNKAHPTEKSTNTTVRRIAYNSASSGLRFACYKGSETVQLYHLTGYYQAKITSAEYATFFSPLPTDFSGTGITVYTATDNGTSVELSEVTSGKVPANTPVVLYKVGGATVNVPVIASAAAVGSNDLHVSTGTDVANMYVLAKKNDVVGFYKWAGSTNLSVGKIYLQGGASAPDFLGFGETTGISSIENGKFSDGAECGVAKTIDNSEVYNLNGQRVAQPTKGLYIVNGKKVIIK